jgi:archaellum component FlaF (FlaF/FlaG flagellin family)
MEQEINQQQFSQPEQKSGWKMKNFIFVGAVSSILGALIVGGIVYLVLNNSYSEKQNRLNNQISVLQDQVNALKRQNEVVNSSPTLVPSPTNNSTTNEATINKGWKKFVSNGKFVFSTDDWQSYSSKNENVSFSIEYPSDWTLGSSVFDDAKGNKIAEFLPGLVILKSGQKCFDKTGESESGRSELISQTNITIGGLQGALKIEKVFYEGGSPNWTGYWYPNIYCISEGDKAFVMSFYEDQLNSDKRELFRKIISTFRFE